MNREKEPKLGEVARRTKKFRCVLQHGDKKPWLVVDGEYDLDAGDLRIKGISGSSVTKLKIMAGAVAFGFFVSIVAEHILVLGMFERTLEFLTVYL